jgi:hypothetical protein
MVWLGAWHLGRVLGTLLGWNVVMMGLDIDQQHHE